MTLLALIALTLVSAGFASLILSAARARAWIAGVIVATGLVALWASKRRDPVAPADHQESIHGLCQGIGLALWSAARDLGAAPDGEPYSAAYIERRHRVARLQAFLDLAQSTATSCVTTTYGCHAQASLAYPFQNPRWKEHAEPLWQAFVLGTPCGFPTE